MAAGSSVILRSVRQSFVEREPARSTRPCGSIYAEISTSDDRCASATNSRARQGGSMKTMVLNLPTFAFVVGTRAALAGGIGLLMSNRLTAGQRRAIGAALAAVGAVTTIPAVFAVVRGLRR